MKVSLMAGVPSFANLLGRAPKAAKSSEEDEDKRKVKRAAEEDDEKGDGDDEGDGADDGKGKKAKRAEGDEEEEDDDDKKAKGKRAKADGDDGDDGDDEDDDGSDMRKRGAKEMQDRCAKIFASEHATKNLAQTAQLAFTTNLSASRVISLLSMAAAPAQSQPRRISLDDRMARVQVPAVGGSDPAAGGHAAKGKDYQAATAILVAGMKRRGKSEDAIQAFITQRNAA